MFCMDAAMKQSPAGRKPQCEGGDMCEEEGANKADYETGKILFHFYLISFVT